ncbi:hypothetical protein [Pseudoalteromonas rubra]|uniref:hypothetical protein n=1 Tax=Pseudoalteromonas rubra TaxID=43658 RepID=UPI000F7B5695|nr:hypothetical protein [Pseudoalteromonas rubra]
MTSDDFKAWAEKYNLSTEEAGAVLGVSRANAFKFANGSRPVSKTVEYSAEAIDLLTKEKSLKLIQKRLA